VFDDKHWLHAHRLGSLLRVHSQWIHVVLFSLDVFFFTGCEHLCNAAAEADAGSRIQVQQCFFYEINLN